MKSPSDSPPDATEPPPGAARSGDEANTAPRAGPDAGAANGPDPRLDLLENRLRRALADLDNLRKRYERELERERSAARGATASSWLPVIDNLERALAHADPRESSLMEGVRATRDQALTILFGLGFSRFEPRGERFDPRAHEAAGAVASDRPSGEIIDVVSPGYRSTGDVLRPARVIVSSGPANQFAR